MPLSSAPGSIDHFLVAIALKSVRQPASYISIPVQAIMAALSVQYFGGGDKILMSLYPLLSRWVLKTCFRYWLLATPPEMTNVLMFVTSGDSRDRRTRETRCSNATRITS